MRLQDYLTETGERPSQFAARIGRQPSTILRILPGRDGGQPKRRPSLDLIHQITEATGGAVTANDFMEHAGAAE